MFSSDKERQFFCDWYFRAQLDENYDADRQFFYFYALFDHLFKTYAQEHEKILKEQGLKFDGSEKSKMKYYLYNTLYLEPERSVFETFNPIVALKNARQMQIIEKIEIQDSESEDSKLPEFSVIEKVFEEIYSIRCNLFHGSADLSDLKNNKLIDEANIVLKDFLGRLFEAKLPDR